MLSYSSLAVAGSVDDDDDACRRVERFQRSLRSSIDVDTRFSGWSFLVIGAWPVELSIAQHHAALRENRALEVRDGASIEPIRKLPGEALREDLRRSTSPRGGDQVVASLGADARVQARELADLRQIIRQIGQLVQHDVRCEVAHRFDQYV